MGARARFLIEELRSVVQPLTGTAADYDRLLETIGDGHVVLLGESTHGTQEFYQARAEFTRRLIIEKGFNAIAVEADWPHAYRVNRYVHAVGEDETPEQALGEFVGFPSWMWRNTAVLDFVKWLRRYNDTQGIRRAGFYGLDLYSLHASIEAVLNYLERVDPEATRRARFRYACLTNFGQDPQAYGYSANYGIAESCEDEVVRQLVELRAGAAAYEQRDGRLEEAEFFYAEQNARVAKSAEAYYRAMYRAGPASWNLRDTHMADTLDALLSYLGRQTGQAKVVVWAHNSHVGDARATEVAQAGEINLGQLVRQRYGADSTLVGFTTYEGTVTAASDWGGNAERKSVRPALPETYERLFHAVGLPGFFLGLKDADELPRGLHARRLERAIGVIYRPETERISHYFTALLPAQFDAVFHYDRTEAVEPLERTSEWERGELPATYPHAV
jgi:erythromycin esterase-like protein